MQSHNISLSVPYNHLAVSSAATMLTKLAEDLKVLEGVPVLPVGEPSINIQGATTGRFPETPAEEPEAKAVFAAPAAADPLNDGIHTMENTYGSTVPTPPAEAPTTVITATGVELDSAGLPWNARIHSTAKSKDAKGYWKYLRGVDREEFVPMIEAELRAMMGTPVESPAELAVIAAEGQADDEMMAGAVFNQSAYREEGLSTPTPPPPPVAATTPSATVTTFAQLITGITSNSIDEAKVNEALALVDITNLALLGARADLIPTVAGHLGL